MKLLGKPKKIKEKMFTVDIEVEDTHSYQLKNGVVSHNSSVLLECSSGIHPHHARRFFRRVQANKNDNVLQHFRKENPHAIEHCIWSNGNVDDVITFPIDVGGRATVKSDLNAIQFLEHVLLTQGHWVKYGTARPSSLEGATHNVSNTAQVKDDEWSDVADYLFENQNSFSGISLLPASGDKVYNQAPMETCFFDKDLYRMYGEKDVKAAKRLCKKIKKKLHVENFQDVRYGFTSLARLNGSFTRKCEWILENCRPLEDDDGNIMEDKWEYESRSEALYNTTLAVYRDIRKSIKDIDNFNTVLDLIASSNDEEKWYALVDYFRKVDYSTLVEQDDVTDLAGEVACAGGACDVSYLIKDKKQDKKVVANASH